jgi:hypothetical protein
VPLAEAEALILTSTAAMLRVAAEYGQVVRMLDGGEHEDEVWLIDARSLHRLLGGLTTRYVGIVMPTHADPGVGSHMVVPPPTR